jgi:hypothetical protein
MKAGISEQFLQRARAFHEQSDVEFIGHADAAVHLHPFLNCAVRAGASVCLGLCDYQSCRAWILVYGLQRAQHQSARELDVDE